MAEGNQPSDDQLDDPDFATWEASVRDELIPKLEKSEATITLVPRGPADIKFAVELGLSIMLDKPIIAIVRPGVPVPKKLRAIADRVLVLDLGEPGARRTVEDTVDELLTSLAGND